MQKQYAIGCIIISACDIIHTDGAYNRDGYNQWVVDAARADPLPTGFFITAVWPCCVIIASTGASKCIAFMGLLHPLYTKCHTNEARPSFRG